MVDTVEEVVPLTERPVDVIARTFYEWGIGGATGVSWDEAPKSIRDRCYHAADVCERGLASLTRTQPPAIEGLVEAGNTLRLLAANGRPGLIADAIAKWEEAIALAKHRQQEGGDA